MNLHKYTTVIMSKESERSWLDFQAHLLQFDKLRHKQQKDLNHFRYLDGLWDTNTSWEYFRNFDKIYKDLSSTLREW